MRWAVAIALVGLMLLSTSQAFAQSGAFDIVKTKTSESFSITSAATNADRKSPFIYTYELPKGNNWIVGIENTLSYNPGDDAKTVVILRDKTSSDKFVEVQMFGGETKKYSVWVSNEEGRTNAYLNEVQGWFTDQPIGVTYAAQNGLEVTDGKRIVVDRLDLGAFDLGSVEVYGRDEPSDPASANAGNLNISVIYGNPIDSPTYLLPFAITGGVGAVIGVLLILKKRKED